MTHAFELAQFNVAVMRAPLESAVMSGFVASLESINSLAERSPGFVWRLSTEEGDATALRPFGTDVLVNLTVWRDLASLRAFVYRSAHAGFLKRRAEWFEPMAARHLVLWWLPRGHRPNIEEGSARLVAIRETGPVREAFDFRCPFEPPGE